MKLIVLAMDPAEPDVWRRQGTVDVQDGLALAVAQQLAVEQMAGGGGVFVALPFEHWRLFRAEAQVTVVPLTRAGEEEPSEEGELGDLDLEGMTQGPRLP